MGMSTSQRTVLAAVAAAVILLAGCDSGDGGSGSGDKAQSAPSAQPSPSASAACEPELGTCRGDLVAGTYRTATFRPPITYTVPPGWSNGIDLPHNFLLSRPGDPALDFYGGNAITIMSNVVAASQKCDDRGEPGVGRTAGDLARWIDRLPGVTATTPRPATVGGWPGFLLDIQLAQGWTKTCPVAEEPMVPLLQTGDPAQFHPTGIFLPKGGSNRLYLLDAPGGGNILIDIIDIPGGISLRDYLPAVTPVVESLYFGA
ncbi:hypothetical protein [Paractinoplanes globisporus]|uniref:Uncharacterized protein n=1 Tax=Paractinoplanes globisporus TaxID=113565 RepID=A0ABW6WY82_9ACTN|nr:hypothetical protein [Actinoplanes globisporus]